MLTRLLRKLKFLLDGLNYVSSNVKLHDGVQLNGCDLNGNIEVGEGSKLHKVSILGDTSIGRNTTLWGPNIFIRTALFGVHIGSFCSIAKDVSIQEHSHDLQCFTTAFIRQNVTKSANYKEEVVSKGKIVIENDVWIGSHSVILGGAHICTGAVVAANSVVNGYVPPYAVVGGSPAKIIKYRFEPETIEALLKTEWWNWSDEKIKGEYASLSKLVARGKAD